MHEIVLPETKPALEWVNNRILQKVSPQQEHALAQLRFGAALEKWASELRCGMVGTELEFRIAPPGEIRRPLVPDVAYLSYARLPRDEQKKTGIPQLPPDVVVEVQSPSDRLRDIEEKIRVYLACGTSVIFLVDPEKQTVTARRKGESRVFNASDIVEDQSLPGFAIPAHTLFEFP